MTGHDGSMIVIIIWAITNHHSIGGVYIYIRVCVHMYIYIHMYIICTCICIYIYICMLQISSIIHTCRDSTNNMVYGCVWKWGGHIFSFTWPLNNGEHHDQPADGMGSLFSDKARNDGCLIDDCILLHEHDYPMIVWLLYTILPWLSHDYPYYCILLVYCLIIPWLSHDFWFMIILSGSLSAAGLGEVSNGCHGFHGRNSWCLNGWKIWRKTMIKPQVT